MDTMQPTGNASQDSHTVTEQVRRFDDETVEIPVIESHAQRLETESAVDDELVAAMLEEIERLLRHDRRAGHRLGAAAARALAGTDAETGARVVDRLLSVIEETALRPRGVAALKSVAVERPEAVSARIDDALSSLDDPRQTVRRRTVAVVAAVVDETDEDLTRVLPRLITFLSETADSNAGTPTEIDSSRIRLLERERQSDREAARVMAARTAARIGRRDPSTAVERISDANVTSEVLSCLDDGQPNVRSAAVGLTTYLAEHDPETVERAIPQLRELVEDETDTVRAGAVWALLELEATDAVETIRRVSREDSAPEIRNLAERACEQLETTRNDTDENQHRD